MSAAVLCLKKGFKDYLPKDIHSIIVSPKSFQIIKSPEGRKGGEINEGAFIWMATDSIFRLS